MINTINLVALLFFCLVLSTRFWTKTLHSLLFSIKPCILSCQGFISKKSGDVWHFYCVPPVSIISPGGPMYDILVFFPVILRSRVTTREPREWFGKIYCANHNNTDNFNNRTCEVWTNLMGFEYVCVWEKQINGLREDVCVCVWVFVEKILLYEDFMVDFVCVHFSSGRCGKDAEFKDDTRINNNNSQ